MEPMNLGAWAIANRPADEMLWRGGAIDQIVFVRDALNPLVQRGIDYDDWNQVRVISTHRSKSIVLPVYEMSRPDLGIRLIARDNFHNWKLSVVSQYDVPVDLSGLCYTSPPRDPGYTGDKLSGCYFEGFPSDLVFGYFDRDRRRFSAELYGEHDMFTAVFLIMRAVGAVQPMRYHTRDEHRAQMDAEKQRRDDRKARAEAK